MIYSNSPPPGELVCTTIVSICNLYPDKREVIVCDFFLFRDVRSCTKDIKRIPSYMNYLKTGLELVFQNYEVTKETIFTWKQCNRNV